MQLNSVGQMIQFQWQSLPERFPTVYMDAFVVMPNHIHGIICLTEQNSPQYSLPFPKEQGHSLGTESGTIGRMLQAFKSITTHQYTQGVKNNGWLPFNGKIWQRNYHEHIVRHETAANSIRNYIAANPLKWSDDEDNPINFSKPPSAS